MLKTSLKNILESMGLYRSSLSGPAYFRDRPRDPFLHQQYFINSYYEKKITIFDIGSYIGNTVEKYYSLFPLATIYSFEPFPDSFNKLCRRFKGRKRVKLTNAAVADNIGTRQFFIRGRYDANSLLPTETTGHRFEHSDASTVSHTIDVVVTTIDDVCHKESITEVPILKMDMEGGELMGLQGATAMLASHQIGLIYTEVTFIPHNKNEPLFHKIIEFLSSYDYTLYDLYNIIRARNGQMRRADSIFLSPQLREMVNSIDPMP